MSKKSKDILKPICIILILLSIILLVKFAWSRYITSLEGTATADIARFRVKVNGQTNNEFEIDFAQTMNPNNSVSSGYVAPGTSGAFTLEIDATESDVSVDYYLSIDASKKPTNLLLYSDSQHNNLMDLPVSNKIISIDSILVSDATKTKSTTIYWDWQYETGDTQELIDANDAIDNKYMEKEIVMPVQLKAVQKNGNGPNTSFKKSLADMVHVGDMVNYNPQNLQDGKTIGTDCTYTAPGTITTAQIAAQTGTGHSENQTFSLNNNDCQITQWRVLGLSKNGEVELMGITPKTITFKGQAGYNNYLEIMNKVASIYGHGAGATGARSIKLEDVEQYTTFDKTTYINPEGLAYGITKTYTFDNKNGRTGIHEGVVFKFEDINENLIQDISGTTNLTKGSIVNLQQTYYTYAINNYKKAGIQNNVYIMLTSGNYWLASRCCYTGPRTCNAGLRWVNSSIIDGIAAFSGEGNVPNGASMSVAPVVSLNVGIKTTGLENQVWQLQLE